VDVAIIDSLLKEGPIVDAPTIECTTVASLKLIVGIAVGDGETTLPCVGLLEGLGTKGI